MRIEELADVLAEPLGDPEPIVDVLVGAMARGHSNQEMWDQLHQAAARDGRLVELATAYHRVIGDKRVKLLPAEQWVELHLGAARVIGSMVGDTDVAVEILGRCLSANPGHEPALALLQELLTEAGQPARLARILLDTARNVEATRSSTALTYLWTATANSDCWNSRRGSLRATPRGKRSSAKRTSAS